MLDQGYINQTEHDDAVNEGLGLDRGYKYTTIKEPYFFDYVEQELIDRYGVNTVRQGGLKVYTSIRPELQEAAAPGDLSTTAMPPTRPPPWLDRCPHRATSSRSPRRAATARATSTSPRPGHRQPGSSFKAYVLTTALRQGIDPYSTTYTSRHLDLSLPEYGSWVVDTAEGSECNCAMTIADATHGVGQHRLRPARPRRRARERRRDRTRHGHREPARRPPRRGDRRTADRRHAARDGGRLLDAGARRNPPRGDGDHQGRVPERRRRRSPGEDKEERVFSDGVAYDRHGHPQDRDQRRHRDRGQHRLPGGRQDRARPTTSPTPGSSATRRGSRPRSGSDTRTRASTLGYDAFGGTLAAPIWHDYMEVAKGDYCGDFPEPQDPIDYQPFYGNYANGGGDVSSSSRLSARAAATPRPRRVRPRPTPSNGGYDPSLYAPGAGQQPVPAPPDDGN